MKSFKQYISESKEKVIIHNNHGSHHFKNSVYNESLTESRNGGDYYKKFLGKDDNLHLGSDSGYQMDKLHDLHPLSDDQKKHFFTHGSYSRDLTDELLKAHKSGSKAPKYVDDHDIEGLDKSFHPAQVDYHTYSGAGFDLRHAEPSGKSKAGHKTYFLPTYMSSSHDKTVAARFAHINKPSDGNYQIIHWNVSKGDPIGVVGRHGKYWSEKETLHPRTDSTPERYHIEHLGTTTYTDDKYGHVYDVHHVRRIPESEIILKKKGK